MKRNRQFDELLARVPEEPWRIKIVNYREGEK